MRKLTLSVFVLSLICMFGAMAATKSWVPTTGGAWTTAANWSPSGAPVAGDDVTIPNDQSANITAMPAITLNSLTINGTCLFASATTGNTLTITSSITIASGKTLTLGITGNRIVFTLNGTATIDGNFAFDAGTTVRNFTVSSGATLIVNPGGRVYDPNLSAGSVFILSSGGTLKIGNSGGISTGVTANTTVAINFGGSYSYSTGANYEYIGTSSQVTGNGLPATVNNLTINNSSGVTLSANNTINGALTLTSGIITTGANTLSISSSGSISRTSGYIFGSLQKYIATGTSVSRTFEIGDATNYTPINVTFATVSGAGNLTARTTAGEFSNISGSGIDPAKSVNRSWNLTNTATVFTTYDAVFNFVSSDVDGGANTSNFVVKKYSGSTWSSLTTGTKTATSTQATGITSFGDFIIGEIISTATQFAINGGNDQSATVNTTVKFSPSVIVKDASNNPVSGVSVTFAITSGGGSGTGLSATTNANGIATIGSWKLGTIAGLNTLTATSGTLSGSPVTFKATGTADTAKKYIVTSSSNSPMAGSTVTITAQLADIYNNAVSVAGNLVTWSKGGAGGSFAAATSLTFANGIAIVGFTPNAIAGTVDSVTATDNAYLTGTSGPITTVVSTINKLVFVQQPTNAISGATISPAISIQLKDQFGNSTAASYIGVKILLSYGSGVISGTDSVLTDENGLVTFADLSINSSGKKVLTAISDGLTSAVSDTFTIQPSTSTSIFQAKAEVPTVYSLGYNFPNPFNPQTKIRYALPENSSVQLFVYDILGREVAELVNMNQPAGFYETMFDGVNLSSGIYFYKITAQAQGKNIFTQVKKMMLIK